MKYIKSDLTISMITAGMILGINSYLNKTDEYYPPVDKIELNSYYDIYSIPATINLKSLKNYKEVLTSNGFTINYNGEIVYDLTIEGNTLFISKKTDSNEQLNKLNSFINQIIKAHKTTCISFENMTEEFDYKTLDFSNIEALKFADSVMDLSQTDLSNIKGLYIENSRSDLTEVDLSNLQRLSLYQCKSDLQLPTISNLKELYVNNCEDLGDLSQLHGTFENVSFKNTPLPASPQFFIQNDFSKSKITITEEINESSNLKDLLKTLVNNQISLETIEITQKNAGNYTGLTNEEFTLLSNLAVESIELDIEGFQTPINLDLEFHDKIKRFELKAQKEIKTRVSFLERITYENAEFGNIKIKSNQKSLNLDFNGLDITSNTHFSLPDQTHISFHSFNCSDTNPIKGLRNADYIWMKADIGQGPFAFHNGAAVYTTDPNFSVCYCSEYEYPITHDDSFKNFDLFMEHLETSHRLLKLQEKYYNLKEKKYLNGPKDIDGYSTNFGTLVTIPEETKVYSNINSLDQRENGVDSYYGSSIARCIHSFVMSNGKTPIEVYSVEDYYLFLDMGYELIGYNLVNFVEETPITEFYCEADDVKRVFTPFDKY